VRISGRIRVKKMINVPLPMAFKELRSPLVISESDIRNVKQFPPGRLLNFYSKMGMDVPGDPSPLVGVSRLPVLPRRHGRVAAMGISTKNVFGKFRRPAFVVSRVEVVVIHISVRTMVLFTVIMANVI
jgi:hypothetical protein